MRGVVAVLAVLVLGGMLAGCLSGPAKPTQADDAGREGRAAPPPGNVTTVTRTASWTAGASAAGHAPDFVGTGTPVEDVAADNLTGVVVEMQWTPSTPLSERMTLEVWERGSGATLGSIAGTSPLRLAFPGTKAAGELVLDGHADDPGAQVEQDYMVYLTTFSGAPFDPAYSALAH